LFRGKGLSESMRMRGKLPVSDAQSRREFLVSIARLLALGGLGALATRLLGGRPAAPGETCVNEGVCRGCPTFVGCGLPQALSARDRGVGTGGAS
jgi:hypothetical protein